MDAKVCRTGYTLTGHERYTRDTSDVNENGR